VIIFKLANRLRITNGNESVDNETKAHRLVMWRLIHYNATTDITTTTVLHLFAVDKNVSARQSCEAPFTLKIYFKILFRNFSFKNKHFCIGNKLSKANIIDALFDVCKHWPTDQSQRSISEISSANFCKIEHVLNCEIQFRNFFLSKVDCSH